MSATLRCLVAGLLLVLAALVLTAGASPSAVGAHAVPALLVILAQAWVLAVAERTCPDRGGSAVPRFPLGPRLLEGGASLTGQLAVPVLLLAAFSRSLPLALGGLVVITVLSTSSLRRMLPFVLPILGAIWAVMTMEEFHTLGDLLESFRGWIMGLLSLILATLVLAGPLLRTDVGGALSPRGVLVTILAGLPGALLGLILASRPDLLGAPPDLLALGGGVLVGGLLHSLVAGGLGRAGDLVAREPHDFGEAAPRDVGLALMLMGLPALALVAFAWVALPASASALAAPVAWAGLAGLLMIVPALPAALLVASGLDRLDGQPVRRGVPSLCGGALLLWFLAGPAVLAWLYAPGGGVWLLHGFVPLVPAPWPMAVGDGGRSLLPLLGGGLTLHGLPAADLCRAVTLMLGATALLALRSLRHAAPGARGMRWGTLVLAGAVSAAGAMLFMPRIGPAGAPLAVTLGAVLLLIVDACRERSPASDAEVVPG